jgi:hypothetical protein
VVTIRPLDRFLVLVGAPAERISGLARDLDADPIATASHYSTLIGQLFRLDKATLILHRAPCPVLICHNDGDLKNPNFGTVRGARTASRFGELAFCIQGERSEPGMLVAVSSFIQRRAQASSLPQAPLHPPSHLSAHSTWVWVRSRGV